MTETNTLVKKPNKSSYLQIKFYKIKIRKVHTGDKVYYTVN